MRLWLLPASLLLCSLSAWSSQEVFETYPTSFTLVDALSADPDYTTLLRLLQRARLIPTLNRLTGPCTFFAPVNSAWTTHPFWKDFIDEQSPYLGDNINEQLRQQLFYHLVNHSIPEPPYQNPIVLKTLHYPHKPLDPPTGLPPPYPPWMPVENGTLGFEPQRLRLAFSNDSARVGVDAFGSGGLEIVKGRVDAGNATLMGISGVLDPPPDLASVMQKEDSLSYFKRISSPHILEFLNASEALSVFLPTNDAWSALHPVERLFLESDFSDDEVKRILTLHAVGQTNVAWSDSFYPAKNFTTLEGTKLEVVVSPDKTMVSGATLLHPDIYAANGVLHLVSSLLIPDNRLRLTPEKYLLALNCSTFVSLLHSVNLTSLVNDTDAKYTILAPSDEVLELYQIGRLGEDGDLPAPGSEDLQDLLSYHFIPGRWLPEQLDDGLLLRTALAERGLEGKQQVLPVEVKKRNNLDDSALIKFGGSGVAGDHIEIGNTVIYFLTKPLTPPADPLQSALPHLHLSSFLASVFSTSLADSLKTTPRTTILVPHNDAYGKRLGGLVTTHLLSSAGKSDLEKVILHHVIDGVHYADSFKASTKHTFPTLEGSDLQMTSVEDSSNHTFSINPSGGWVGLSSTLLPTNIITRTGVLHEATDLLLPRSVDINYGKLLRAASGDTMIRLISAAGYGWILNGTAPPKDSDWDKDKFKDATWVILCPDDDAFPEQTLRELLGKESRDDLRAVVEQHLIPYPSNAALTSLTGPRLENSRPLIFEDSPTYSTLRSSDSAYGDLVITRPEAQSSWIVGIKGARGTDADKDWARIVSWGRASVSVDSLVAKKGGGVIKIDRVLYPYYPPWWLAVGVPILVGILGVLGISALFMGIRKFWTREPEATYEPVGGFGATGASDGDG